MLTYEHICEIIDPEGFLCVCHLSLQSVHPPTPQYPAPIPSFT